jgi:hypothetical protein
VDKVGVSATEDETLKRHEDRFDTLGMIPDTSGRVISPEKGPDGPPGA